MALQILLQIGSTPMLTLLAFLIGVGLSLWFRALILLPAMMFVGLAMVAAAVMRPGIFSSTIVTIVCVFAGLQIGYLAGVIFRATIFRSEADRAASQSDLFKRYPYL
jgi:predicted membrane channel-forming protein YqfA (hemolysin III family)